ncbi:hypothetical protein B7P43_G05726 [Cryptotermes secundus]|uniref:Uncharacterized protein n=3 Tax=Cryptotermes secundus TaxID=105785 RepID=A0A2J7QU29_9NEOP|nr:hypothetical protein B7P43_G05726 [Cryptotermes secundus]
MTLYSRRTFSKESFQWTKCVVKYLYDTYAHLSLNMLAFLVEVLEKGPTAVQLPVLSIIHCMLHYVDLASAASQPINADLLRVIAKYIEGAHYKEALKILKLVVTRSSTLVAPPTSLHAPHWETSATSPHPSFTDSEIFTKKELPGRTMDFTFDLSQTPVIGRRFLVKADEKGPSGGSAASPRRSLSLSPADNASIAGWKRPWMSQGRVRECLVNLLTTCGQRVGLPKSPSVIFSQSSDLMERQSSMASSTEEVSGPMNDLSGGSRRDEGATEQFGVFKDFDFLEYESESVEGESTDNFNWGVRRRPLSDGETEREPSLRQLEESLSEKTPVLGKRKPRGVAEESSDDEVGSESPLDEVAVAPEFGGSSAAGSGVYPPSSLSLHEHRTRHDSGTRSDTSGSSTGDLGDVTPCNASPNLSALMAFRPIARDDTEEMWRLQIQSLLNQIPASPIELFQLLHRLIKDVSSKTVSLTQEASQYLSGSAAVTTSQGAALLGSRLLVVTELLSTQTEPPHVWISPNVVASPRLTEALRFGMLEIQEHWETYLDRKDHVAECIDAVKTTVKLNLLGENQSELGNEELILDLGRALYKLHFQLLLLIEASNKMVAALTAVAHNNQLQDVSAEVAAVKASLTRVVEEGADSDHGTPTPTPSPAPTSVTAGCEEAETALLELVQAGKWAAALQHARHNRGAWGSDVSPCGVEEDDITGILNVFCKHLAHDKCDVFVVTRTQQDMADVFTRLMESLFQVLGAVNALDSQVRDQREHSDSSLRKTEC